MSTDEIHDNFTLNLENRKVEYEYTSVKFVSSLNQEQLKECIEKQYPNAIFVVNNEEIKITKNNTVLSVKQEVQNSFLFRKRYIYVMETECINLKTSSDDYICIPFPKEYLDIEGMYDNIMNISCDIEQLKTFYKDFTNVNISENEVTIEQDVSVKLTIENGKVYISFY